MPKTPRLTRTFEAQEAAKKFVQEYLRQMPMGLSKLEGDDFVQAMTAITYAMIQAWADGYFTGRK